MKKVWILEKFASAEEMAKSQADMEAMLEAVKADNKGEIDVHSVEMSVAKYKEVVLANPNGRWYGFEGKIKYSEFCYTAKAAIRRNPEGKFRVVEAEIEDDAKYWIGYKNAKVNDCVYRYLMATK